MIPKIIHYTKTSCKFSTIKDNIQSWKKVFKDWEIKFWDPDKLNIKSKIFSLAKKENRLDILSEYLKIWTIHNYGGIFIKSDTEIKNINISEDVLLNKKFFIELGDDGINWDIVGCEKRNLVSLQLLNCLDKLVDLNSNINQTLTQYLINNYKINLISENIQQLSRLDIFPQNTFVLNNKLIQNNDLISVIMPVWNGEKFIKEAIVSVLNQTHKNIELVIIDDGSTDSTEKIINSFSDHRIKYIKKEHSGISDSLNLGIKESSGKFIARMDCDDLMYSDRLKIQLDYLKQNPSVDILGTGFEWGNEKIDKEYFKPKQGKVELQELLEVGNTVGHPTVMMRKESLLRVFSDYDIYESYFNGAEDYKLWITSILKGLTIHNISQPTLYYRQHPNQETLNKKSINNTYRIRCAYLRKNNKDTEMTAVIPFKNEGIEVEKTVISIRATSNCNIILINDFSNDGFNYKKIAELFDCKYIESSYPLGVAGSRDLGVNNVETPYFVLLDSHMRFYDDDWELRVVKHLKEHTKSIITSNSSIFTKEKGKPYKNEDGHDINKNSSSKAAVVNFKDPGWEFTGKWTRTTDIVNYSDNLSLCSCVMGAFYASSCEWWKHIGGLQGLVMWGYDEPLMCIKTYLAGGECLILRDFYVGHLYRGNSPYVSYNAGIDSNHIYLINLFIQDKELVNKYEENFKQRIGEFRFKQAKQAFLNRYNDLKKFKTHFYKNISKRSWEEFLEINDKFY